VGDSPSRAATGNNNADLRGRENRHALRVLTVFLLGALLAAVCGHAAASRAAGLCPSGCARIARTYVLSETGQLHRTGGRQTINQINEQGSASGTITGTIYIHLHETSPNSVTAEVNIYPAGGSITGTAGAGFRNNGSYATFNGTMTIVRGTGRYAHAHGSGLSFTGTIQRGNDATTVRVKGRMST